MKAWLGTGWRFFRDRWRWAERALAILGLAAVIYHSCFHMARVTSPSMHPTLQGTSWSNGDTVLAERVTMRFRRPRRWEVIALRSPEFGTVMKRVVGLPGERVQMRRGGRLFINGELHAPPPSLAFLKYFPFGNLTQDRIVECGDGYFVLGDDSQDSDDSRFNGPVSPAQVVGHAWLIVAPRSRVGFVR